jgi:crotonobetainyl-CoA:carnitine CoA-transferase CaiB-like acyl-CoA transferase
VVTVRDDHDWQRLVGILGMPDDPTLRRLEGRLERRTEIEDSLAKWTAGRTPEEVARILQRAGVPAAGMLRLPDELTDPQLVARDAFHTLDHPLLKVPIPAAARIARFSTVPDPDLRAAPVLGEHTEEICAEILGMAGKEVRELVARGVLQVHAPGDPG